MGYSFVHAPLEFNKSGDKQLVSNMMELQVNSPVVDEKHFMKIMVRKTVNLPKIQEILFPSDNDKQKKRRLKGTNNKKQQNKQHKYYDSVERTMKMLKKMNR